MKKKIIIAIAVVIAILVLCTIVIVIEHSKINKWNKTTENNISSIEGLLDKKANSISNLISSVKKFTYDEDELVTKLSTDRENIISSQDLNEKLELNEQLTADLNELEEKLEQYEELKESSRYITANNELADTENKLNQIVTLYNENTDKYNKAIKRFPINIFTNYETKENIEITNKLNFEKINTGSEILNNIEHKDNDEVKITVK